MRPIFAVALLSTITAARDILSTITATSDKEFFDFVARYNKKYLTYEEFKIRLNNWKLATWQVQALNADGGSAKFSVNFTADFSDEEYRALMGFISYPESAYDADLYWDDFDLEVDNTETAVSFTKIGTVLDSDDLKCFDDLDP